MKLGVFHAGGLALRLILGGTLALVLSVVAVEPTWASSDDYRGADHHGSGHDRIDEHAAYQAIVRRTEGGIPHISGADYASVGFGTGYAMAEDILCLLADQRFLTFSAQRSRFLGPQGGNLESDFFYQLFIDRGEAREPVDSRQAAIFRGAAAGYNRYLRDTGLDNLPDASCRGQPWVREISEVDFRRISRMNFLLPFLSNLIVAARPPATSVAAESEQRKGLSPEQAREVERAMVAITEPLKHLGSNGVALGGKATVNGRGMMLANPHQGWSGIARFYAFHQTLPGEFNAIGSNVIGRPQVALAATEHVAWTSTVSTAPRNTFYVLTLVPGNPTQYLFDGQPRDMIAETVTVQVPNGSGGFENRSHTFYSTHFDAFLVGGAFPWTSQVAIAVRPTLDGWRGVNSLVEQWRAKSVRELKAVHDKYQFSPSNMIAADSSGFAYYADPGPVPNLTDAQLAACAVPGGVDGSRSECMWGTDPDAAVAGIFGPRNLPSLIRRDFVTNSNDSFWLTNPEQPLTGFNSSLGSINTQRTLRTRSGLSMVLDRLAGTDGQAGKRFTLDQLQMLMMSNEAYAAQLLRDGFVALCQRNPQVTLPGPTVVDISEACPVLTAYDLHDNLGSRGTHLFREIMRAGGGGNRLPAAWNYIVPFDLNDPIDTPRGLDPDNNPAALQALATAVQRLRSSGIPLDAPLGDLQYVTRNGERIPIHGGIEPEGVFNMISAPFVAGVGYPNVTSGSSWIQATAWTSKGPVSRGILTYSQSPNPESPHFADMTKLFSAKRWVDLPFHRHEVIAAALDTVRLEEGKDDCKHNGWRAFTNPAFSSQGACVAHYENLRQARLKEIRKRRF